MVVAAPVEGFRGGDWMCPQCNNHNYASKIACNKCGAAKAGAQVAPQAQRGAGAAGAAPGGSFRSGDWLCPSCGNHNYASKIACNRCGTPNVGAQVGSGPGAPPMAFGYGKAPVAAPAARPSPYGGSAVGTPTSGNAMGMRPGDWCCPHCYNHNFASKTTCNKCHMPKNVQMHGPIPGAQMGNAMGGDMMGALMGMLNGGSMTGGGAPGAPGAKRPGDWTCYACGNNNYASRTDACNRCSLPKTVYVSKSGMRPGDWVCPACSNHNWADRTACMKCQTPKADNQVHTKGMRPGDWLCAQCNNHNYSSKERCNRCQRPKQAGALTMPHA